MRRLTYLAGVLPVLLAGCALPGPGPAKRAELPPTPAAATAAATAPAAAPTAAGEPAPVVAPAPPLATKDPTSPSAPRPPGEAAPAKPAAPSPASVATRPRATATPATSAPSAPATPAATPPTPAAPAVAAAPRPPPGPPPLDLHALEQRLRDTRAVGVFTKLSIKNQVDDLLTQFRSFHRGQRPPTLPDLRQKYEVLLLKVVTVVQDGDAPLAGAVASSREAIWGILADPNKFASI